MQCLIVVDLQKLVQRIGQLGARNINFAPIHHFKQTIEVVVDTLLRRLLISASVIGQCLLQGRQLRGGSCGNLCFLEGSQLLFRFIQELDPSVSDTGPLLLVHHINFAELMTRFLNGPVDFLQGLDSYQLVLIHVIQAIVDFAQVHQAE
ncbi:hypothetical protein D3C75_764280 [compost metagenome]